MQTKGSYFQENNGKCYHCVEPVQVIIPSLKPVFSEKLFVVHCEKRRFGEQSGSTKTNLRLSNTGKR